MAPRRSVRVREYLADTDTWDSLSLASALALEVEVDVELEFVAFAFSHTLREGGRLVIIPTLVAIQFSAVCSLNDRLLQTRFAATLPLTVTQKATHLH